LSVDEGESPGEAQPKRFSRASSHLSSKVCSSGIYTNIYTYIEGTGEGQAKHFSRRSSDLCSKVCCKVGYIYIDIYIYVYIQREGWSTGEGQAYTRRSIFRESPQTCAAK
jgi:hypothetical protein